MKEFILKKPKKTVISVRIETDILEEIEKLANQMNLSRNEVICQSLKYAMENKANKM